MVYNRSLRHACDMERRVAALGGHASMAKIQSLSTPTKPRPSPRGSRSASLAGARRAASAKRCRRKPRPGQRIGDRRNAERRRQRSRGAPAGLIKWAVGRGPANPSHGRDALRASTPARATISRSASLPDWFCPGRREMPTTSQAPCFETTRPPHRPERDALERAFPPHGSASRISIGSLSAARMDGSSLRKRCPATARAPTRGRG